MAGAKGKLIAYVAFYKPADVADNWETTDLWNSASEIPDVSVLTDENGVLAASFNAATSGQAVLYDQQGALLFAGGITAGRGHSGDNFGRAAIVSLLNEHAGGQVEGPVFGCPIFDRHSECNEGVKKCAR